MSETVTEPQPSSGSTFRRDELRWAAALILVVTGLRLWAAADAGLNPDEAYYWVWSKHFALSYRDKGPLVAWTISLGTAIFVSAKRPLAASVWQALQLLLLPTEPRANQEMGTRACKLRHAGVAVMRRGSLGDTVRKRTPASVSHASAG